MTTANEIEDALGELRNRRDELRDGIEEELLRAARTIEDLGSELDVELADCHYEAVVRGIDETITGLDGIGESELRELASLAAVRFPGDRLAPVDDVEDLRPAPVPTDPASIELDEDDDEFVRDDEVRRTLSNNIDDQANHLRYLVGRSADLVRGAVAAAMSGNTDQALMTIHARDQTVTAMRAALKAWEIALAALDEHTPGAAGIASEMIDVAHRVLREEG